METKELILGTVFLSIVVLAGLNMFVDGANSYNVNIPPVFNSSIDKFAQVENLTEEMSNSIQQDTFNPVTTFVAITKGILSFIKLTFLIPEMLIFITQTIGLQYGFPSWIEDVVAVIVFLSIIIMAIVLIGKIVPKDRD